MPIINSISNMKKEMQEWRRHLHTIPELGFEESKTSEFISKKLIDFGIEVHQNIAETGVVGALQFEVLASRIELEYGLPVNFESSQFTSARWISGPKNTISKFIESNKIHIAYDNDGDLIYLTRIQWDIDRITRDFPEITLNTTKELMS